MLYFSFSPRLQKDTLLTHLLKGQGTSVFLYRLLLSARPSFLQWRVPQGTGVSLPPFPLYPPPLWRQGDRCGVFWPCSDLLTWGGSLLPYRPPALTPPGSLDLDLEEVNKRGSKGVDWGKRSKNDKDRGGGLGDRTNAKKSQISQSECTE